MKISTVNSFKFLERERVFCLVTVYNDLLYFLNSFNKCLFDVVTYLELKCSHYQNEVPIVKEKITYTKK